MKVKGREFHSIIIHKPVPSDSVTCSRKASFYNQITSRAGIHTKSGVSHNHWFFTTQNEGGFLLRGLHECPSVEQGIQVERKKHGRTVCLPRRLNLWLYNWKKKKQTLCQHWSSAVTEGGKWCWKGHFYFFYLTMSLEISNVINTI